MQYRVCEAGASAWPTGPAAHPARQAESTVLRPASAERERHRRAQPTPGRLRAPTDGADAGAWWSTAEPRRRAIEDRVGLRQRPLPRGAAAGSARSANPRREARPGQVLGRRRAVVVWAGVHRRGLLGRERGAAHGCRRRRRGGRGEVRRDLLGLVGRVGRGRQRRGVGRRRLLGRLDERRVPPRDGRRRRDRRGQGGALLARAAAPAALGLRGGRRHGRLLPLRPMTRGRRREGGQLASHASTQRQARKRADARSEYPCARCRAQASPRRHSRRQPTQKQWHAAAAWLSLPCAASSPARRRRRTCLADPCCQRPLPLRRCWVLVPGCPSSWDWGVLVVGMG